MAAPRIVLVDDHALCRNGLTDLLTHRGGMEVLAALSDPEQVIAVLRETQPALVVLAAWKLGEGRAVVLRRVGVGVGVGMGVGRGAARSCASSAGRAGGS